ncbi:MAG: BolA family transcriptional regulator [Hahellaceae bacterium]|nr:BolA family transcriptional regulator [Hahellaceae bacterium]
MNIEQFIKDTLATDFAPSFMEVLNESHQHSVPKNSETHFKIVLVSDTFEGKSKVARHQLLYKNLDAALKGGVHALAMHLYTPEEWKLANAQSPDSPQCMGGSKKEPLAAKRASV